MRFKPGQEVVCIIDKGDWYGIEADSPVPGPAFHEVVTVKENASDRFITLHEYRFFNGMELVYLEMFFEPLVSDEKLEEELQGISEEITVKKQMPY